MISDKELSVLSGYFSYYRDESIFIKEFYSVQEVYMPEKHRSGRECYDFWELVYVADGELNTNSGNAFYNLKKGSLILFEPFKFHTLDVAENNFAKLFIMSFNISGPVISKLKQLPLYLDEKQQYDMQRIINLCAEQISPDFEAFCDNEKEFKVVTYHQMFLEKPLFLYKLCALTEFLLLSLCDMSASKIPSITNYETITFFAITEDMKRHKSKFFTIEELSFMHNISPTTAKNLIKKYSGLSLHKYYLGLKISQAIGLFKKGYNIIEASQELGFCNSNYFSTVFKRETGENPSKYISKLKEFL